MNSSQTNKNITNVIDIKVIMCYGYFQIHNDVFKQKQGGALS